MNRVLLSMFLACSLPATSQNCISFLADIRNYDTLDWAQMDDSICLEVYSNGFSNAGDFGVFAFRHNRVQLGKQMILTCAEKGISRERFEASLNASGLFADKSFSAEYDSVFSKYTGKIKENEEFILLEKLYNIDQFVRIEYKKVMKKEAFYELLKTTDSLNFVILKHAFLNRASSFNESLIGLDGSYYLYLLLLHNLRYVNAGEFAEFEKILHEMTTAGHFSANYYALIMDERLKAQGNSDFPMYNFHNVKTDAVKIALINKNRKTLGLKFLINQ